MSKIVNYLEESNDPQIVEIPVDKKILDKVNKYASIKYISKIINNDEHKLVEICDEIIKDLSSLEIDIISPSSINAILPPLYASGDICPTIKP